MRARLGPLLSAVVARHLSGSLHEDERTRSGRLAGALLLLGAAAALGLLPALPPRIDRPLAVGLATSCVLAGLVLPWLPWHRWPHTALVAPLAFAFPVVLAGGLLGGDLDYYALYFPLLFLYCGHTFPPRCTGWLLLAPLLGLVLTGVRPQPPGTVPFVLLGSLLAAVCGIVLALQRQDEQRGQAAMRQLVEAASTLGAAEHPQQLARSLASTAARLLDARGVAVVLPAHGSAPCITVAEGSLAAGPDGALPADLVGAVPLDGRTDRAVLGRRGSSPGAPVLVTVPLSSGPAGQDGAGPPGVIVGELRAPVRHRDHFAVRTLELLAVEGGRVLARLHHGETLLARSRTDPLTGLGNRLVLDAALAAAVPGDTVLLLDLDHFKQVNDGHGHAVGDEVLVRFAEVLRQTVRPGQVLTRFGGEEFAVVAQGLPADGLLRHLHHLRSAWAATSPLTTYSCGVAVQQEGETGAQALARADRALYRAKRQGRDQDALDGGEPAVTDAASA